MIDKALPFCFLLLASFCFSQQQSLLYSIKGKDAHTSYLFGTVHLIADSAFYFPGKLDKTLQKADNLVLEINPLADQAKAAQLMELDSGNMFSIFSLEQADSVVIWGSGLMNLKPDVFIRGFAGKKPFVLIQFAAMDMIQKPVKSYEMELMAKARANKQPVLGLETMEYQVGLFDQLPDSVMAEMVMSGIRNPEEISRNQRELTRLYAAQDTEGLAKLILESDDIAGNAETLVFQRNRNWIPVMEQFMQTNSCFFAVGAGHLGGEKGIIQLLKNAGYTVTPIAY
jgi:uncharacterized protein YbaP (TraB family)